MIAAPTWFALPKPLLATIVAAALSLFVIMIGSPHAETEPPKPAPGAGEQSAPAPQPESAPQPSPSPSEKGSLLDQMGRFFDGMLPPMKTPGETLGDFNSRAKDAAKEAGDALSRLAKPGTMVSGRTLCPSAANGTPDCKIGADKLCQAKGYKEGKSLNTGSAETCSPKVLIPGRQRKPDDCRTDNYVTTALCQ
jgi:hypothetical protein